MRRGTATAWPRSRRLLARPGGVGGGPALSGGPYVPDPVEFEAAVPDRAAGRPCARARATSVSRVVRPGRRFNLVGLRWRGGHIDSLASACAATAAAGAAGSRSAPTPTTRRTPVARAPRRGTAPTPLWAGEADEVQYRARRRPPRARPAAALREHDRHGDAPRGCARAARSRTARQRGRRARRRSRHADTAQPPIVAARAVGRRQVPAARATRRTAR